MRPSRIAPRAATPTATPVRRQALLIPEAMPVREGSTARSAAAAIAGFARPMPIPRDDQAGQQRRPARARRQPVHQQQRDGDEHQPDRRAAQPQRCARRELARRSAARRRRRPSAAGSAGRRRAASSRACPAGRSRGTGRARTSRPRCRTSPPRRRRTRGGGRGSRSSIGRACRCSTATKTASSTAPPISEPRIRALLQPSALPRSTPKTIRKSEAENVSRPQTSVRVACGSRDSRIRVSAMNERERADRHVDEEDPAPARARR